LITTLTRLWLNTLFVFIHLTYARSAVRLIGNLLYTCMYMTRECYSKLDDIRHCSCYIRLYLQE